MSRKLSYQDSKLFELDILCGLFQQLARVRPHETLLLAKEYWIPQFNQVEVFLFLVLDDLKLF